MSKELFENVEEYNNFVTGKGIRSLYKILKTHTPEKITLEAYQGRTLWDTVLVTPNELKEAVKDIRDSSNSSLTFKWTFQK